MTRLFLHSVLLSLMLPSCLLLGPAQGTQSIHVTVRDHKGQKINKFRYNREASLLKWSTDIYVRQNDLDLFLFDPSSFFGSTDTVYEPHVYSATTPRIKVELLQNGTLVTSGYLEENSTFSVPQTGRFVVRCSTTIQVDGDTVEEQTNVPFGGTLVAPTLIEGIDDHGRFEFYKIAIFEKNGMLAYRYFKRRSYFVTSSTITYVSSGESDEAVVVLPHDPDTLGTVSSDRNTTGILVADQVVTLTNIGMKQAAKKALTDLFISGDSLATERASASFLCGALVNLVYVGISPEEDLNADTFARIGINQAIGTGINLVLWSAGYGANAQFAVGVVGAYTMALLWDAVYLRNLVLDLGYSIADDFLITKGTNSTGGSSLHLKNLGLKVHAVRLGYLSHDGVISQNEYGYYEHLDTDESAIFQGMSSTWFHPNSNSMLVFNAFVIGASRTYNISLFYNTLSVVQSEPVMITMHASYPGRNTDIRVFFNKEMDDATFSNSTVQVTGSISGVHFCAFSFDHSTNELTINPNTDFTYGETVTVTIGTGVTDLFGVGLAQPYEFSFQIGPAPQFTVYPSAGSHGQVNPNTPQPVTGGSTPQFCANPDPEYEVDSWYVGGQKKAGNLTCFTLTPVQQNESVLVTFRPITYLITINSPNTGQVWCRDDRLRISWEWTGIIGQNVKIELLKGGALNTVITASTRNTGYFTWNDIPSSQPEGTDYSVRITSVEDPTISRTGGNFEIQACTPPSGPIQVTSFDGQESSGQVSLKGLSDYWGDSLHPRSGHYVLTDDIDADDSSSPAWNGGLGFDPIGRGNFEFTGTFDGKGHTIKEFRIARDTENFVGLFETVRPRAVIRDVTIEYDRLYGHDNVGGIAAYNHGTIIGCAVKRANNTSIHAYGEFLGGIVGENQETGKVLNCALVDGEIHGEDDFGNPDHIGGIVGLNRGLVQGCYSTGRLISSDSSEGDKIGGIVGTNSSASAIVRDCYSSVGLVKGRNEVGGIVGENLQGAIVQDCYFSGNSVNGDDHVGGVIGENSSDILRCYSLVQSLSGRYIGSIVGYGGGNITDCFFTSTYPCVGNTSTSGNCAMKTAEEMTHAETFTNWEFINVWAIDEGVDHPKLRGTGELLPAPTNLTAVSGQSDGVHLSWTGVTYDLAGSTHQAKYHVYRAETLGGAKSLLTPDWRPVSTFLDDGAFPNVTYYYFVKAAATLNGARESRDFSNAASGSRGYPQVGTPDEVEATDGRFDGTLVEWELVPGANLYQVFRSLPGVKGSESPVSGLTDKVFVVDTTSEADVGYEYWVEAFVDGTGLGRSQASQSDPGNYVLLDRVAPSVAVSASPEFPIETRDVTLIVSATEENEVDQIILHWSDGVSDSTYSWTGPFPKATVLNHLIGDFAAGSLLIYWAEVIDSGDNRAESPHVSVQVSPDFVSVPSRPDGPTALKSGESADFTTGGAFTTLENPVEYQIDWGDGSALIWNGTTASKAWNIDGYYFVRTKARSQISPNRESNWSSSLLVAVDTVPPTVEILSHGGIDFATSAYEVILEGTAEDSVYSSGIASVTVSSGATNEGTLENWRFSLTMNEGENRFAVAATDQAGNEGTAVITITLLPCIGSADLNNDSIINGLDLIEFLRQMKGYNPSPGYEEADLNCDGGQNFLDILKFMVESSETSP